jgi:hypothetical protein
MSTNRTARIAITVLGTLLLAYVLFISWTLWDLRPRTVSLTAQPLALRDDATALALAHTAMRKFGYDPAAFVPPPPGTPYDFAPDLRRFDFFPASGTAIADHLGVHVRLEQNGTTVVCDVARKK